MLVEFCSQTLQVYTDHFLALDIMTVGEGLLNLPIKAECVVPKITPSVALLDFEECYLRYGMQGMPVHVRFVLCSLVHVSNKPVICIECV